MTTVPSCPRCGADIQAGNRFCGQCGADASGEQNLATTVHTPQPSNITRVAEAEMLEALRQSTLGEYDIQGELGRGGMAIVYIAHDIGLDRKVAIKVMSPALLTGQGMVERFKREARTSAALTHPNIIPIYAVKETDRLLYFVMKFIPGRSLDAIIHDAGPLSFGVVRSILAEVGDALGFAHKNGVIHRDIKPANIIVDEQGRAIVTDFGIAKMTGAENLTASGAAVGTPSYMSPEQCSGKELTGASDQYSLGIVGYEMLTGQQPFHGDVIMDIMRKHFFEPVPKVSAGRRDCPKDLRQAVEKALAKKPDERFDSMEALVAHVSRGGASDVAARDELIAMAKRGIAEQQSKKAATPKSPVPPPAAPVSAHAPTVPSGGVPPAPSPEFASSETEMVAGTDPASIAATTNAMASAKRGFRWAVVAPLVALIGIGAVAATVLLPANDANDGVVLDGAGDGFAPTDPADGQAAPGGAGQGGGGPAPATPIAEAAAQAATSRTPPVAPAPEPARAQQRPAQRAAAGRTGVLLVEVRPAATMTVDGRPYGRRSRFALSLPAARHAISFQRPQFAGVDTTVVVTPGDPVLLRMTLTKGG